MQKRTMTRSSRHLAVDGGATKTAMVLFRSDGVVLRHVTGPPSNACSVGFETATTVLRQMFAEWITPEPNAEPYLQSVFLGLAGGGLPRNTLRFRRFLESCFPDVPFLDNGSDAIGAMNSGLGVGDGMALIAGTGSILHVRQDGHVQPMGGWGHLLGDEGSGYDLGRMALQSMLRRRDDGRSPSRLAQRIAQHLDGPVDDVLFQVYADGKRAIAALAPLVFKAADDGDADAHRILNRGARQLARLIRRSCRHFNATPYRVVLSGGIWNADGNPMRTRLQTCLGDDVELITPSLPPIYGCAIEALSIAGMAPSASFETQFRRSWGIPRRIEVGDMEIRAGNVEPSDRKGLPHDVPTDHPGRVLDALRTEQVNPETVALDTVSTVDMVRRMNRIDHDVAPRVGEAAEAIAAAIDHVVQRMRTGGRLVYVGCGTSGRLGIMDAAECPPTFGIEPDRISCIMAGGRDAVFRPQESLEDDPGQAERDLEAFGLNATDVVLALASSGRTPYAIGALTFAARIGAGRIALCCNKPALLSRYAEVAIEVDTGPETIMGSTRLKAGTAQKLVLNMISTLSMVHLGHVYRNLMVNVRGQNEKLRRRTVRIFAAATDNPDPNIAHECIEAAGGDLKTAIVMHQAGVDTVSAAEALQRQDGSVRNAIRSLQRPKPVNGTQKHEKPPP